MFNYNLINSPSYIFDVYKRVDEYLAVFVSGNSQFEVHHYIDQGFIYWGRLNASSSALAADAARTQDGSTISSLKLKVSQQESEINRLLGELENARSEQVKKNNDPLGVEPLKILGLDKLSVAPTNKEIKARYKFLIQRNHSDRGGSDFITSLINAAYEKLGGVS